MRRKRNKSRADEAVQLNLAAMLDMAFQLLTFFILTFKPPAVEAQMLMHLPAPRGTVPKEQIDPNSEVNPGILGGVETLAIAVYAQTPAAGVAVESSGRIKSLAYTIGSGRNPLPANPAELTNVVQRIFDQHTFIKQVIIQVDNDLRYSELMRVVEACKKVQVEEGGKRGPLGKLSFIPATSK